MAMHPHGREQHRHRQPPLHLAKQTSPTPWQKGASSKPQAPQRPWVMASV